MPDVCESAAVVGKVSGHDQMFNARVSRWEHSAGTACLEKGKYTLPPQNWVHCRGRGDLEGRW